MEPRLEQVVRVLGVNNPGLLTCVAQSFSSVNVAVDSVRLARSATDATLAVIEIAYRADERSSDLICRRVSRLIDVLEISTNAEFEPDAEVETKSEDSVDPVITEPVRNFSYRTAAIPALIDN